jgi:hypothetical protein
MPIPIQASESAIPQWAIDLLVWIALAVIGLFTGVIGWFTRKYIVKVDVHSDLIGAISATYATIKMVNAMEEKIPSMVSRAEFLAYMRDFREDQLRMHKDNLDSSKTTRDEIREDIRAVHQRVDDIFMNGHDR